MVTIEELARETGFSPTTVSIVLRGKAKDRQISAATAEKILTTASRRGYRPNIAARSLREGEGARQLQLAVFWAQDFRAGMLMRFLEGLRRRLKETARDIRLVVFPYDNDALALCRPLISASDCHAAIVCNASKTDMEFLESRVLSLPIVLYNRYSTRYCSVNVDDADMGTLAARALVSNDSRRLAILTNPPVFEGMNIRARAFIETAHQAEAETLPAFFCDSSVRGGYNAVKEMLRTLSPFPDGIFCASSAIGLGALHALFEAGVSVPQQCRIVSVGNGNEEADEFSFPPQSVVRLPMEEMAGDCLDLVLDVVAGKTYPPASRLQPLKYVQRGSCGKILEQF